MTGQATPAQIGGYLMALRMKGETVEEITGSARAMRAQASRVAAYHPRAATCCDTAGTGGDEPHTFNISTAAALVIAGTGRKVAKHGNRAASSQLRQRRRAGGAGGQHRSDAGAGGHVHRAGRHRLHVRAQIPPGHEARHRPAARVGPAHHLQPAGPAHQPGRRRPPADRRVLTAALTEPLANVLGSLGGKAALVVHGYGGLDELTTSGTNRVSHLKDGEVRTYELRPARGWACAAPVRRISAAATPIKTRPSCAIFSMGKIPARAATWCC